MDGKDELHNILTGGTGNPDDAIRKLHMGMVGEQQSGKLGHSEEVKQDSELRQHMEELKQASEVGVTARTPIGQRFARSTAAKSIEYKKMQSHERKAEFRRQWAELEWKKAKTHYENRQNYKSIDISRGVYLPPSRIVQEEGGKDDKENILASVRYIKKCCLLGGRFVKFNQFTERYEFLYFKTEVQHIWEQVFWCCCVFLQMWGKLFFQIWNE